MSRLTNALYLTDVCMMVYNIMRLNMGKTDRKMGLTDRMNDNDNEESIRKVATIWGFRVDDVMNKIYHNG